VDESEPAGIGVVVTAGAGGEGAVARDRGVGDRGLEFVDEGAALGEALVAGEGAGADRQGPVAGVEDAGGGTARVGEDRAAGDGDRPIVADAATELGRVLGEGAGGDGDRAEAGAVSVVGETAARETGRIAGEGAVADRHRAAELVSEAGAEGGRVLRQG